MRSWHFVVGAAAVAACGGATTGEKATGAGCVIGTKYLAPDGCNTCQCTAEGSACTEIACPANRAQDAGAGVGARTPCDAIATRASDELSAFVLSHRSCEKDTDCVLVEFSTSCFDACTRMIAGPSKTDYEALRASIRQNECADFTNGACTLTHPPCDPPPARSCVNKLCQ